MNVGPIVTMLLLLGAGTAAFAQTACPQGVAAGSAQCGPSSMVNPSVEDHRYHEPPIPEVRWEDSWGAIASDGAGNFGIVTDLSSKRKAKNAAIAECRKRGGDVCAVRLEFLNQCAAVVVSTKWAESANGPTVEEAVQAGTRGCGNSDTGKCWVYWTGCSMAKRVW